MEQSTESKTSTYLVQPTTNFVADLTIWKLFGKLVFRNVTKLSISCWLRSHLHNRFATFNNNFFSSGVDDLHFCGYLNCRGTSWTLIAFFYFGEREFLRIFWPTVTSFSHYCVTSLRLNLLCIVASLYNIPSSVLYSSLLKSIFMKTEPALCVFMTLACTQLRSGSDFQ